MKSKQKLVMFIMGVFLLFTNISAGWAASEDRITLEEAKELAKNSRTLRQYELDIETAKYKYYQAEDEYDEAKTPSYYNLLPYYFYLTERQAAGEDVSTQLANVERDISAAKERLDEEADKSANLKDKMEDAEESYEDSKKEKEKYEKQLEYTVEQLYTSILNQEDTIAKLQKDYDLKLTLLNIERKKLELGKTTQEKVNDLAIQASNLNKSIISSENALKNLKGRFNDLLGREFAAKLDLASFNVPEAIVIPVYNTLLSKVSQDYDKIAQLEKDIENKKDDLDDDNVEDVVYQSELINLEIKEKELQIEEEKYKLNETVNNLLTDLKIKQKDYQLAKIELENAQKKYDWDKKRFAIGQISKLDLLESEQSFLESKNKYTEAGYDFYLATHTLELAEQGILVSSY